MHWLFLEVSCSCFRTALERGEQKPGKAKRRVWARREQQHLLRRSCVGRRVSQSRLVRGRRKCTSHSSKRGLGPYQVPVSDSP